MPSVIDVGARGEQCVGHVGREAEAVRGVLGVDDREVDAQRLPQPRQRHAHGITAGASDHVAQEQNSHSAGHTGDDAEFGRDGVKRRVMRPDGDGVHLLAGERAADPPRVGQNSRKVRS